MSGIDEQLTQRIPIPAGRHAGVVPEYWCLKNKRGNIICWLQQDVSEDRKHFKSDFIVNKDYLGNAWTINALKDVYYVESVLPYSFTSINEKFIDEIVSELNKVYLKMGVVIN